MSNLINPVLCSIFTIGSKDGQHVTWVGIVFGIAWLISRFFQDAEHSRELKEKQDKDDQQSSHSRNLPQPQTSRRDYFIGWALYVGSIAAFFFGCYLSLVNMLGGFGLYAGYCLIVIGLVAFLGIVIVRAIRSH
jgi:hypothetical protein